MTKKILLSITSLGLASMTYAGAFQLNLQGIRQSAMGGSGTAKAWDITSMFFNPGAMSQVSTIQAYASVNFVNPSVGYSQYPTAGYQAQAKRNPSTPFAVYVGGALKENGKLAVGLGVYTPFGSNAEWDKDWAGRYIIQNISLQSIFFQPTVSYRFNDQWSAGAGFVYGIGSVEIEKALPAQSQNGTDATARLKGDANGFGFNLGIQYRPSSTLSFGLNYRHGVKMKVNDGTATFNVPSSIAGNFPTDGRTGFNTHLPLPNIITAGVAIDVNKRLTLQADLVFANWAAYKSLDFKFNETTPMVQNSSDVRDYKNTLAIRLGANYKILENLDVMLGAAYDPTPTRSNLVSPDAVDGDRIVLTGGLSYNPIPKLSIMVAVNYTTVPTRNTSYSPANFSGAYQIRSFIPALGVAYKF